MTFETRIPTLSDEALQAYLDRPGDYRPEAVALARAELRRRGRDVPEPAPPPPVAAVPRGPTARQWRLAATWILVLGLGAALVVALLTEPSDADPALDPLQSKRYLRDLEMWGGRLNVIASEFQAWFKSLWHGRALAATLGVLSLVLSLFCRFMAPMARDAGPGPGSRS